MTARIGAGVAFRDAEFVACLDEIAGSIGSYHANPNARETLPSLYEGRK
jgi:hypothetical protein